jgi:hypothetical protein
MQLGSHNASVPGKAGKEAHSDGNLIDVDTDGDDSSTYPRLFQNSTLVTTCSLALCMRRRNKSALAESAGPNAVGVGWGPRR